jgi:hypothetical protein
MDQIRTALDIKKEKNLKTAGASKSSIDKIKTASGSWKVSTSR